MISKSLSNLEDEKRNYETNLNNAGTEDEKQAIKKEFIDGLKLYLFETNNIMKEVFSTKITPFNTVPGINALFKDNASNIIKKTKEEFFREIDSLINNSIYYTLEASKKAAVDAAVYVLKTYYENSLI